MTLEMEVDRSRGLGHEDRCARRILAWEISIEDLNVQFAFHILEDDEALPVGWTPASGHII